MSQSQEDDFTSVRKRIAVKIRLLRACRGLSQEALAQKSGLSTRHLQKLEAGQVNVTVESLSKLSKALEVDISRLFRAVRGGNPVNFDFLTAFRERMLAEAPYLEVIGILSGDDRLYSLGTDTKVLSTVFELMVRPLLFELARDNGLVFVDPPSKTITPISLSCGTNWITKRSPLT